jgi:hypothetical protein
MALRQKQLNASINTTGTAKVPEQTPPLPPPSKRTKTFNSANFKKSTDKEKSEKTIDSKPEIEVQGNALVRCGRFRTVGRRRRRMRT